MMIMHQLDERVRKMNGVLEQYAVCGSVDIGNIEIAPRGSNAFRPFENGSFWAPEEGDNWADFRFSFVIPEHFSQRVILSFETGMNGWEATAPQMLIRLNGKIDQAVDSRHKEVLIQHQAKPGERYDVFIEAYFETKRSGAGLDQPRLKLCLSDVYEEARQLYYDINVPLEAAKLLDPGSRSRETALETLSDALNLLDMRTPGSEAFKASVREARAYLKENYYDRLGDVQPEAIAECVGHTHIDVAWLWDLEQTRHKAARTFSTMLKLMDEYPDFKFMSSQPHLYQVVKEDHPELFERIRDAVRRGQWEAEGGMWVEADCNVSGGEALVRQFLYGNEFFIKEFGKRSRILWLPDVFGYSAALPQILKKCGIDYFMTTKLSWSEFNCTPYDTFNWKGIDGSEVLTHLSPARGCSDGFSSLRNFYTTYNAMLTPDLIKGGWKRFQQKGLDNHYLVCCGYGDGGGGTCDWMIENGRRMKNPVADCPAVQPVFARDFFEKLEKRVGGNKRLPKWSGELYLEYHRGTYTSQGPTKRNNRKAEIAIRDCEYWLTRAGEKGMLYPQDRLREIWRNVLTMQFHDILPGDSIHKVYTDSDAIYAQAFRDIAQLRAEAMTYLAASADGDMQAVNTLSHVRSDLIRFDAPEGVCALRDAEGNRYPAQRLGDKYIAFVRDMPAMGGKKLWFEYGPEDAPRVTLTEDAFETPYFTGRFDGTKGICSLVDKENGREIARPGQSLNRIVYYENRPHNYDAWDINIYYEEHSWDLDRPESVQIVAAGPVAAVLRVCWKISMSEIRQDYVFYADVKRVDFDTFVDWREEHALLKAHFPVDVFYNAAQFDIQYGNVSRATHKNTSWDVARFEVCAHKWVDVSEGAYGVSLLNDCKYGYSVNENGMALTMLKSSTSPDPTADQTEHVFSYSLMPHMGDWRAAAIPQKAYEFNIPAVQESACGELASFAAVDVPNVMVETVKKALFGEGTIIRMYECYGSRTKAVLTLKDAPASACYTSLMEDDEEKAVFDGRSLVMEFKPYEIKTIRVL